MKAKVNKVTIEVLQGDLFAQDVDAIVISSDVSLTPSDELLAKAGEAIQQEITAAGSGDVGSAIITGAGSLTYAKHVIHAVGPRWGEGSERGKLGNATWKCLELAEDHHLKSIALPAISVGAMGYPVENCARIMIEKVIDFTFENLKHLRTVMFCLKDDNITTIFKEEFQRQLDALQRSGEGKVRV